MFQEARDEHLMSVKLDVSVYWPQRRSDYQDHKLCHAFCTTDTASLLGIFSSKPDIENRFSAWETWVFPEVLPWGVFCESASIIVSMDG
jgi:hypothetical protein